MIFFIKNKYSTLIEMSQGCLNTCSFCQRKAWNNEYKTHSLEYIISEFYVLHRNQFKNIWIVDDNFTFDLDRAKKILMEIINNKLSIGMKIAISSWSKIDEEFLDIAKMANISIISIGIESANSEILKFYKKDINLERISKLIDYADSIGIFVVGNFIIGAPMETKLSIQETFDFISKSKLDQVNIKILDYMIGSELYKQLEFKEKHHYFSCSENGLCNFKLQELIDMKQSFFK